MYLTGEQQVVVYHKDSRTKAEAPIFERPKLALPSRLSQTAAQPGGGEGLHTLANTSA